MFYVAAASSKQNCEGGKKAMLSFPTPEKGEGIKLILSAIFQL